ncbi:MAG: DoxX family protein [Pseudonocardiaceae bacterium]
MDIALWVGQGVLAVMFALSGLVKVTQSKERLLATGQTGVRDVPLIGIRAIAVCELLAAAGLILPWATGTARALTPVAALGLAAIMVGAGVIHARLGEPRNVAINIVLLLICLILAVARFNGV